MRFTFLFENVSYKKMWHILHLVEVEMIFLFFMSESLHLLKDTFWVESKEMFYVCIYNK